MPGKKTQVTGEGSPVSELGPDTAGELAALNGTAYALTAELAGEPSREQVAADLADPDVLTLGVREPAGGEHLIAAASVRVDPGDPGVADVGLLVVEPGRGRRGLGGLLLRAAEQRLPGRVRELWLQVAPSDENSLRFYARHGYREAHREQSPGGTMVHLVKRRSRRGAADRPAL